MKLIASLIGAAALAALSLSAHAQAVKPDLGKGAASFGQVCAACHAADGNSVITANPKLAGQHPEYLVKQLTEFKSGKRANAVMSGMAATLSDDDMRNVAFWLASQKPANGAAKDKELVALGEWQPAQYPRLAGQHAEYTSNQLKTFRSGERKNSAQMTGIAAYLTDKEIAAVSDYIAGLR